MLISCLLMNILKTAKITLLLSFINQISPSAGLEAQDSATVGAAIDFYSIIKITYEKNLEIAAARYEIEETDFQFRRFERNLSQFVPLVVDSQIERESERNLIGGNRITQNEDEARVTVGVEKEFFDGKKFAAGVGVRATSNDDGENANPFIGGELRFPLFSSVTTLERVTERTFEQNELLEAWLDFIDTVRDEVSDSQEDYIDLQNSIKRLKLAEVTVRDFQNLLDETKIIGTGNGDEIRQIEDQIQAFLSMTVNQRGNVDIWQIGLLDSLGLDVLPLEKVEPLEMRGDDYYGKQYIEKDLEQIITEAIQNDVEIKVLNIARQNAELKKSLAERGKWDIIGKLFGTYDFENRGDNIRRPTGFGVGLGFSVQRTDPKLLRLSLQQAEAEIRKFTADITWRERQVKNLIRRRVSHVRNRRILVNELSVSRELRNSVYLQKLEAFRKGNETMDNLIQSRVSLFETEKEFLEQIAEFFETVVDLDVASGYYFQQLGKVFKEIGEAYNFNKF